MTWSWHEEHQDQLPQLPPLSQAFTARIKVKLVNVHGVVPPGNDDCGDDDDVDDDDDDDDFGTSERQKELKRESGNTATWEPGIWDPENPRTREPDNLGTQESRTPGTQDPRNPGTQ